MTLNETFFRVTLMESSGSMFVRVKKTTAWSLNNVLFYGLFTFCEELHEAEELRKQHVN